MKKYVCIFIFFVFNSLSAFSLGIGEYNGNKHLISTSATVLGSSWVIAYSEGIKGNDTIDLTVIETGNRLYFMIATILEKQNTNGFITNGDTIAFYAYDNDNKKVIQYNGIKKAIVTTEEKWIFVIGYAEFKGNIYIQNVISIDQMEIFLKNNVKIQE